MLLGIIQTTIDEKKSDDRIYYLIVKNQSTKTATIDKRFWIKIDGEQITLKDVEESIPITMTPKTMNSPKIRRLTLVCYITVAYFL